MAIDEEKRMRLIQRQKRFVLDVFSMCEGLPKEYAHQVCARQLIRSASSVGANYRAACRAKSAADFINKMKIVEEEADESVYWIDLLKEMKGTNQEWLTNLFNEAKELLAITVATIKSARGTR